MLSSPFPRYTTCFKYYHLSINPALTPLNNFDGFCFWINFSWKKLEKKKYIYIYMFLLEKAMAPRSSTLAWKIPWTEEPCRLQSMGSLESDTTERPHFPFSLSCTGEGNGNPLQCSRLENPRDGEPGGLQSMGSNRIRQDWNHLAAAAYVCLLWFLESIGAIWSKLHCSPFKLTLHELITLVYVT